MKPFFLFVATLFCFEVFAQTPKPKSEVKVINEQAINSANYDYSPAFFQDGIAFISNRPIDKKDQKYDKVIKEKTFSLYRGTRQLNGRVEKPEIFFNDMNSKLHEGPLCFNRTQDEAFFCQNNMRKGKELKARDGKVKMNIYQAKLVDKVWQYDEKPFIADTEYDYMHPSISVDGRFLYFSSNKPGGLGGMDLWVCEKTNTGWSEPRNLGAPVNTPANEVFPFYHADGTLFFSTDVPGGAGGLDMVYSFNEKEGWTLPENLGVPFNTDKDDIGLIVDVDKKNGYFSSNRPGGKGNDDIYSFYSKDPIAQRPVPAPEMLVVTVIDEVSGEKLSEACMSWYDKDELIASQVIPNPSGSATVIGGKEGTELRPIDNGKACTDDKGIVEMESPKSSLLFNVEKPGYAPRQMSYVPRTGSNTMIIPIRKDSASAQLNLTLTDGNAPMTGAKMILKNDNTSEEKEVYTDPLGKLKVNLPCDQAYTLTIYHKEKAPEIRKIERVPCDNSSSNASNVINESIAIEPEPTAPPAGLEEGAIIGLPNIYYNFNDHQIRPDASRDLDMVVNLMKQYPDLEIELGSHTDARGGSGYNDTLSQKRAESARAFIINNGIAEKRISARGYGEQQLLNKCADGAKCSEFEHQRNRRTEVKVTKAPKNVKTKSLGNQPEMVDSAPMSVIKMTGGPVAENLTQTPPATKAPEPKPDAISKQEPTKPTKPTKLVKSTETSTVTEGAPTSSNPTNSTPVSTESATQAPTLGKLYLDKPIQQGKNLPMYILIAGSFSSEDNARKQAAIIKSLGINEVDVRYETSKTLISVVVGPYSKLSDALRDAENMNQNGIDVFVTKPK